MLFVLCLSCRCSILLNDTVKCDGGLYKSLQAWKDHKLHIEHEVMEHFSWKVPHKILFSRWSDVYHELLVTQRMFLYI